MEKIGIKTVCEKNQCAGCMACIDICPRQCITIHDEIKSYNAVIDKNKCIDCNACRRVCQEVSSPRLLKPIYWKEGWAKDESMRKNSSSGGFATAISLAFVKNGGTVCSCAFSNGEFKFLFAESENEVYSFRGSKYVKSNPQGVFNRIKDKVNCGQQVLFIGLPCQVAAIKNFVGDCEALYTIDLICHGTPSPRILNKFLLDYNIDINNVKEIGFRDKTNFFLNLETKKFTVPNVIDNYTMTFLNSTTYTDNCYNCKHAKIERVSDITLGDSWGSELPKDIQNKGVSLVLCQTQKGIELLNQSNLHLLDVDLNKAIQANHQLSHPAVEASQRKLFIEQLVKGKSFKSAVFKCYRKKYIKDVIKTLNYNVGKIPNKIKQNIIK